MKIFSSIAILVLVFLSACGSENTESNVTTHVVDAWTPFVQVLPPGNIWDVSTNGEEYPPEMRITAPHMTRQERMAHEIRLLYGFFAPRPTLGGWLPDFHYPNYFGGLGWTDDFEYMIVLIVEGMDDEAAELLEFLEDFQTIEIRTSHYSFNDLMYVQNQIWYAGVYPIMWWSHIDPVASSIVVRLFSYTEEEKRFFRRFVTDSPIIEFECVFKAMGEDALAFFWSDPPPLLNQLENVAIISSIQNRRDFTVNIRNNSGFDDLFINHSSLEIYRNGRWILIYKNIFLHEHGLPNLGQGTNVLKLDTSHFTRQFDGPFRINVLVLQTNRPEAHHLTYTF